MVFNWPAHSPQVQNSTNAMAWATLKSMVACATTADETLHLQVHREPSTQVSAAILLFMATGVIYGLMMIDLGYSYNLIIAI